MAIRKEVLHRRGALTSPRDAALRGAALDATTRAGARPRAGVDGMDLNRG